MHRSILARATIVLAVVAMCPAAQAQEQPRAAAATSGAGEDEVLLKNGGVVRGTVVSLDPGHEVVILVSGTEKPRTIPWAEVGDVQRGKYADGAHVAPPVAGYGTPAPERAAPAADGSKGVVRLHVETPEPDVQLYEHLGTSVASAYNAVVVVNHTRPVCAAPCDEVVDGRQGQQFFFVGDGMPASEPFRLSDQHGDVTAKVQPGSSGRLALGATSATLGGLSLLLGIPATIMGYAMTTTEVSTDYSGDEPVEHTREVDAIPAFKTAGPIMIGAGAAALVGGIVLIATGRTKVVFSPSTAKPRTEAAAVSASTGRWTF